MATAVVDSASEGPDLSDRTGAQRRGAEVGFQVGALQYLYDRVSISPSVITGTSAGAILGTLPAQGDSREEQRQILTKIEGVAQRLQSSEDLFRQTPWFADLVQASPALRGRLADQLRVPSSRMATLPQPSVGSRSRDASGA